MQLRDKLIIWLWPTEAIVGSAEWDLILSEVEPVMSKLLFVSKHYSGECKTIEEMMFHGEVGEWTVQASDEMKNDILADFDKEQHK